MAPYKLNIKRSARKALDKIPQERIRERVEGAIAALADDPRPPNSKALQGKFADYTRVAVGSYRVVYLARDEELVVLVVLVAQREGVYEMLERLG